MASPSPWPSTDIEALDSLFDSFAVGGAALDVEGMRRLLRRASADPHGGGTAGWLLAGDRARTSELARFLTREALDAGRF